MNVQETKSELTGEIAARQITSGAAAAAERTIHFAVRDDGICVLTFDRPNSSANIFDIATLNELAVELEFIERQTKLKGVIFISAKPSIFIAGADLNALRAAATPEAAR